MSQWVVFHVTERCGLGCRHCLRDPGKQPADLPLEVVRKVLPQAAVLPQAELTRLAPVRGLVRVKRKSISSFSLLPRPMGPTPKF